MHKLQKKYLFTITYIILGLFCAIILNNINSIENIISNNKQIGYNTDYVIFSNWEKQDSRIEYISKEDSYLEIKGINTYINDIVINVKLTNINGPIHPQIYWKDDKNNEYSEANSVVSTPQITKNGYRIKVNKDVTDLRIDLTNDNNVLMLYNGLNINPRNINISWQDFMPYIIIFILIYFLLFRSDISNIIYSNKKLILSLVKNDMHSRYAGSILGILWAFIQPIATIIVMWFVFQVGFRNPPVSNIEFILWFSAGYIPWMFISDSITFSTNCLTEYNYLVKKIKFKVEILPVIKIISGALVNSIFLLFLMGMFIFYGHTPQVSWIQVIYYWICSITLMTGLSFLLSSVSVFLKDFSQIISVFLQLLFWISPIVWAPENISQQFLPILKCNPFYYIVQGYRDSFIYNVGFWEHSRMTVYFWIITVIIFILGVTVFKKLKIHFSDLL